MSTASKSSNGHAGECNQKVTVAALAKAKQLPESFLRELGLTDESYGVGITYYAEDGAQAAVKKRSAIKALDGSKWPYKVPLLAYGLWRLEQARKFGVLYAVEGESDCWALWYHKLPALGIPGANNAKVLTAEALLGIGIVYVCKEPGQSGDTFIPCVASQLAKLRWQGSAKQIRMPEGCKDPADLHCHLPNHQGFATALAKCVEKALPLPTAVQTSALKQNRNGSNGQNANGTNGHNGHETPSIQVTTKQLLVNNAAIAALGADPKIFQRDGLLVQARIDSDSGKPPQIVPLEIATLRERLAHVASWYRLMETKTREVPVPTHPPDWSVAAVLVRGEWEGIRRLKGVVEYPVLLPSGEVLSKPGYDPASGMLLEWPHKALTIPAQPTRPQVARAVSMLEEVIADFPFAKAEHEAAWYAALLTPLCRYAFSGPAPLFLVSANTRGTGKSMLVQTILHILLGNAGAISSYPKDDDKRKTFITSLALGGERYVFLDNLKGRFGDETLDGVLTSTAWADRMYHTQGRKQMELRVVWYVTGNNLQIVDDTSRRVLPIRLESRLERPERRSGFKHADLVEWVKQQRPRLLTAALTILRGYTAAGRPRQNLQTWGSYVNWSELVRGALVWAGLPDPYTQHANEDIIVDDQRAAVAALLQYMEQVDEAGKGLSSAQILGMDPGCYHSELHPRMKAILIEMIGEKRLEPISVGKMLAKHVGSRLGGRYLKMKTVDGTSRWVVLTEAGGSTGSNPK